MKRREFLAVAAALPLLPAIEMEATPLVLPPIAGEQPGSVFFDNLSTLNWSEGDGSVSYFDWMGVMLEEWKPGDENYDSILDLFVKFPLPRLHEKSRRCS
ncbi:hypothetical protein [Anatilimnocola aggregata]|nr:hypothetical protein [Anatilimnocola aggregata]